MKINSSELLNGEELVEFSSSENFYLNSTQIRLCHKLCYVTAVMSRKVVGNYKNDYWMVFIDHIQKLRIIIICKLVLYANLDIKKKPNMHPVSP